MTPLLFAALLAVAPPSTSAEVAPPAEDDVTITVTGRRDVAKTISEFVGALTRQPFAQQLAKFEQPICPHVVGLPAAQAAMMVARMRKVAAAITREKVTAKCDPNVLLVVTPDKPTFMREIARRKGELFSNLSGGQVRKLVRDPSPVSAWQVRGADLNARGQEIRPETAGGVPINRTTDPATRLTAAARPQFEFAVVVVDSGQLDGLSTTQLADYGLMRALAAIDTSKLSPDAPSILRIIGAPADAEVPLSLTAWDFGFLRGLYGAPDNAYVGSQRRAIAREMERRIKNSE
ncbi:hypothetical protein [Sphingomonas sp. LHG3406-1]|uniref:hypothetical protein n=1 Tax=Sphingomonas sp. LHG3406-1 TaxID=2804617 RepID=UPI002627EF75|nr:hypothetical protein [Sphingomonas sp. LHG3406-1]